MKISTKGRYALRIMMDLANNENDEFISLKDISKRINISIKYLEQIVYILRVYTKKLLGFMCKVELNKINFKI